MHDKKNHSNGQFVAAFRQRAGCDRTLDGIAAARQGELCAAIDELFAIAPRHYANAAIEFIV